MQLLFWAVSAHVMQDLGGIAVHAGVVGGTDGSAVAGAGPCMALAWPFPFVLVRLPASAQAAHAAGKLVCELTT